MAKYKLSRLAKDYADRYKSFSDQLHNGWVHLLIQDELLRLATGVYENEEGYREKDVIKSPSPVNPERRKESRLKGKNIPGFIRRVQKKDIPESVFLNAVALFEAFVTDIAKLAYQAHPQRFLLREDKDSQTSSESAEKENIKLLKILIDSASREEAIERCVEERLRGIFYGKPTDVFEKNKLGFNLHIVMKDSCGKELTRYAEIAARRNVIVHNLGRIDQKYLREVPNTSFEARDEVEIDKHYLYEALHTLNVLAKRYVNQVAISTTVEHKPLPNI